MEKGAAAVVLLKSPIRISVVSPVADTPTLTGAFASRPAGSAVTVEEGGPSTTSRGPRGAEAGFERNAGPGGGPFRVAVLRVVVGLRGRGRAPLPPVPGKTRAPASEAADHCPRGGDEEQQAHRREHD